MSRDDPYPGDTFERRLAIVSDPTVFDEGWTETISYKDFEGHNV